MSIWDRVTSLDLLRKEVKRARFSFTSRTANGGQAYLLRRREF